MSVILYHPSKPDLECKDPTALANSLKQGYTPTKPEKTAKTEEIVEEVETPECAYEKKFGRKPHHRMTQDSIIKALEE